MTKQTGLIQSIPDDLCTSTFYDRRYLSWVVVFLKVRSIVLMACYTPLFYPLTGAIEWCQDNTRLVWCFCYRNVSIYWPLISKQLSPLTQSFLCIPKHLVLYYDTDQPNDFKFPLRFSSAVCKIILTRTCLLITLMNQRVKLWRIKKELKIRRWWSLDNMTSRLILSHLFKPLECLSSKIYWKLLSDSPRLLVNPVFFLSFFSVRLDLQCRFTNYLFLSNR